MTNVTTGDALVSATAKEISRHIREVPDFPKKGVSFKDVTPLVENGSAFRAAVDGMARATEKMDYERVLCAEARGFVFGAALAYRSTKGLALARKPEKLPRKTVSASYELEYGSNSLEIHADSIPVNNRVLIVDDLLATGGTARAMCRLVENAGGVVAGVAFLIELGFLNGRKLLAPYEVASLLTYHDDQ